jgi:thiol-disulfide isomerase/thioredoxin
MFVGVLLSLALSFSIAQAQRQHSSTPVLLSIDVQGLDAVRQESKGRVLVMNFWATWCKPCVEEFPDLVKLHRTFRDKGLNVVFVSIDDDDSSTKQKVVTFLRKMNVASTSYIKKDDDDEAFINEVNSKWNGAVPATFFYNRNGEMVMMKTGENDYSTLEGIAQPLLDE